MTSSNYACIRYATATDPLGPWTHRGIVLDQVSSTTNHPAIIDFEGEWWMVYHTADAPGGGNFRRSVAIDKLFWNEDGTMQKVVQTPIPVEPDPEPNDNAALTATPSCSYTSPWESCAAINDGIDPPQSNDALNPRWGTWPQTGTHWIQLDWSRPVRVDRSEMFFFQDVADNVNGGVKRPQSWFIQYWDGSGWVDLPNASGYPTTLNGYNTTTFDPVTTTRLRATMQTWTTPIPAAGVGVLEWKVRSVEPASVDPVEVSTPLGVHPDLPETVTVRYDDGSSLEAGVWWPPISEELYAVAGTFSVTGVIENNLVEATATVHVDNCPDGYSAQQTVTFGDRDSGVPNYDRGDGCTFLDVVWAAAPFVDHGAFVNTVDTTSAQWREEGLLTRGSAAGSWPPRPAPMWHEKAPDPDRRDDPMRWLGAGWPGTSVPGRPAPRRPALRPVGRPTSYRRCVVDQWICQRLDAILAGNVSDHIEVQLHLARGASPCTAGRVTVTVSARRGPVGVSEGGSPVNAGAAVRCGAPGPVRPSRFQARGRGGNVVEHRMRRMPRRRVVAVTAAVVLAAGSVVAAAPVQAADTNLIVNGGFEDGLANWFANNGNPTDSATLSLTPDAYSGSSAVLVTNRTTTGSGPMQDLSGKVQAGQTYPLSARIKYENPDGPATKQFFATMHYGGVSYTNLVSVTATKGQWAQFNGHFTIPAGQNVSTARLFFETPWTSNPSADPSFHLMDFKLDDVSVIGAAPPPPPSKTIEVVGKLPGEHNPLIGHKFGADGFGFVHDGRVYMYLTNDTQGYAPDPVTGVSPPINYGNINQITVISSTDLVNWTDHGEIQVAGPNGVAPFTANSWAPGMAKKVVNGQEKFFLYYANGGGSSNVITGESPLGPWISERTSTLIDGRTPGAEAVAWKFDPAPLVDDDGEAYLYFGGGPASTSMPPAERFNNPKNLRAIKLGDDMVSTEGRPWWSMPRWPSRPPMSSSGRASTTSRTRRTSAATTSAGTRRRFPATRALARSAT